MGPSDPPTWQKLKNTLLVDTASWVGPQTTEIPLKMGCFCLSRANFPRFWPDFTLSHPPSGQPRMPMTPPSARISRTPSWWGLQLSLGIKPLRSHSRWGVSVPLGLISHDFGTISAYPTSPPTNHGPQLLPHLPETQEHPPGGSCSLRWPSNHWDLTPDGVFLSPSGQLHTIVARFQPISPPHQPTMDASDPPTCQKLKNTLLVDTATCVGPQTTEFPLKMGCICPPRDNFP